MNFLQFLLILRARLRIVLYTLAATVATTLVVSLLLPKQYAATATVLVDVKSPDPVGGFVLPAQILPGYMATQIDIINSQKVALKVVKKLQMADNPTAREQWQEETEGEGSIEIWLAELLQKKLDVKPARESNVVQINYTAADPKFAAIVANAFAQAYIDANLDLKVEPARQYASWFDERTRQLRDSYEQAQARLSAYQREHGIVAADERLDVESARLAELSTQQVAIQGLKSETQSRQAQARANTDTLPEVLQNGLIQGLKSDLARAEAKLQEAGGQLGRNHPQVQRMQSEVEALQEKIDAETQRIVGGISTSNRVNAQREAEVKSALAAQKQRVLEIKKHRDELAVLQREVESAQRAYDLVTQRLVQSSLESQSTQTNIALLNPAVAPLRHASPKLFLNLALAVFLGGMLGVGAAFLMELADQRIRGQDDLAQTLGLPVLGVLDQPAEPPGWAALARLWPFRRRAAAEAAP